MSASLVVLCAVIALAAVTLWLSIDPGPPAPEQADWLAARQVMQNEFEAGDGIRVRPFWLREAAAVLGELGPVDLSLPPDPLFVAKHKRLWLISAMGRETLAPPTDLSGPDFDERGSGNIVVRRYRVKDSPLVLDLLAQLRSAVVERWVGSSAHQRCRWNGTLHKCHGEIWQSVRIENKEVGGSPRRCLVMHPFPDHGTVAITFPKLTWSKGVLVRMGFTLEAARRPQGSDAEVVFRVNGEQRATKEVARNGWEWAPTWIDTRDIAGQTGSFTIEVSAQKQDYRELCLDAFLMSRSLQE